jgi:hypothetical protein
MTHPSVGVTVAVCFLGSAFDASETLALLESEAATAGDILLLQAPETHDLITQPPRYSKSGKAGRGMPTFKQFAFFQHAAAMLPSVPFIGKSDGGVSGIRTWRLRDPN